MSRGNDFVLSRSSLTVIVAIAMATGFSAAYAGQQDNSFYFGFIIGLSLVLCVELLIVVARRMSWVG